MILFLVGLVVFFGLHFFSAVRSRADGQDLREELGQGPYMGLYSLVSLVGFGLIVYGFGEARAEGYGALYSPPVWMRHLNLLLMVPALILLVASQLPTGRIKKRTRHPMLLAVKIWAIGHILSNGEVVSLILFGSFLGYAVFDRIMVKKRGDNGPGSDVALAPVMDIAAVLVGLGLWAALAFWLHPVLFGVAVIG